MSGINEGCGRHGVGVTDVLGVEELSLVRHDLGGLLAVEYREVGGHVDKDAGVRCQATGSLCPYERRRSRARGRGRSRGAGRGGRTGLAGWWASGGAGHHRDGFQEAATTRRASCRASWGQFLFGSKATAAAHCNHGAHQDEGYKHGAHDQEWHIDGHYRETQKENTFIFKQSWWGEIKMTLSQRNSSSHILLLICCTSKATCELRQTLEVDWSVWSRVEDWRVYARTGSPGSLEPSLAVITFVLICFNPSHPAVSSAPSTL